VRRGSAGSPRSLPPAPGRPRSRYQARSSDGGRRRGRSPPWHRRCPRPPALHRRGRRAKVGVQRLALLSRKRHMLQPGTTAIAEHVSGRAAGDQVAKQDGVSPHVAPQPPRPGWPPHPLSQPTDHVEDAFFPELEEFFPARPAGPVARLLLEKFPTGTISSTPRRLRSRM